MSINTLEKINYKSIFINMAYKIFKRFIKEIGGKYYNLIFLPTMCCIYTINF